MDSLKGQLLLASPALFDPNFRRTVVLVTEHNDEGAAGLVLNRPSETAVADAVPDLLPLVDDDERVFVGGPVQEQAVLVLAEFDDPDDAAMLVVGDVGFVPGDGDFDVLAGATRRARVFAGYAGLGARANSRPSSRSRRGSSSEPGARPLRRAGGGSLGRGAPRQGRRLPRGRADAGRSFGQLTVNASLAGETE